MTVFCLKMCLFEYMTALLEYKSGGVNLPLKYKWTGTSLSSPVG